MSDLKTEYTALLSSVQLYLLKEHSIKESLFIDFETFHFFKERHAKSSPKPQQPKAKQQSSSLQTGASTKPQKTPKRAPPMNPKPTNAPLPGESKVPILTKPLAAAFRVSPSPVVSKSEQRRKNEDFSLQEMRALLLQVGAKQKILDEIPNDAQAIQIKNQWKELQRIPEALILSFDEPGQQHQLLRNIAFAIHTTFAEAKVLPARLIEANEEWDRVLNHEALKLVICSRAGLNSLPNLKQHWREIPKRGKHMLLRTPTIVIADLSIYLTKPMLKAALWKAITEHLTNG